MTKWKSAWPVGVLAVAIVCAPAGADAEWLRLDSPPDVDKDAPDLSCWLATAANMLAGAGYGAGPPDSVQARAEMIYSQLLDNFDPFV